MPADTKPPVVLTVKDWLWILSIAVALMWVGSLYMGIFFPRYEYHLVNDGSAMVIYDRWSGRFQRAVYDADGNATAKRVLVPF